MVDIKQRILETLKTCSGGVSVSQLLEFIGNDIPRRTLQRALTELADNGDIIRVGKGRGVRYQAIRAEVDLPMEVILSEPAKAVQEYVRQALEKRERVKYQKEFLSSYEPNTTYYLDEDVRSYLASIGKLPDGDQPQGTYARIVLNRFLIDLSWNSSRLEGNTYSLLEAQRLLFEGEIADGKSVIDTQMILNHKAAIEFIVDNIEETGLDKFTIMNLHALLSDNLISNPESIGRLRKIPVGIGKTAYQPLNIPQLLEDYFGMILRKANAITDPFEQSFFLMVHIPYLQAFEDVNKRVSRLAVNIPLIKNNYCPLSFVQLAEKNYIEGVLGVYELNDVALLAEVFIDSYKRSVKRYKIIKDSVNEPDPFRMKYRSQLKTIIKAIVQHQVIPREVSAFIENWMKGEIPDSEQSQFQTIIESELLNLHIGNFARFQLRLSEFEAWHEQWKASKK